MEISKTQIVDLDLSGFITKSVNDLTNYYLKSEAYTKSEVQALIGAIQQFHYEIYASTSDVTTPANNVLYLIGPTGTGADKYEEYVYDSTKQEPWVKIGDTSIDISLSVVAEALLYLYNENKALRELLSGKDNAVLPVVKAQSVECDDILTLGVPNVLVSSVEGAPSAANVPDNWDEETMTVWNGCPRKIGQQYVAKASGKVYYAIKVTGSTGDWVALN